MSIIKKLIFILNSNGNFNIADKWENEIISVARKYRKICNNYYQICSVSGKYGNMIDDNRLSLVYENLVPYEFQLKILYQIIARNDSYNFLSNKFKTLDPLLFKDYGSLAIIPSLGDINRSPDLISFDDGGYKINDTVCEESDVRSYLLSLPDMSLICKWFRKPTYYEVVLGKTSENIIKCFDVYKKESIKTDRLISDEKKFCSVKDDNSPLIKRMICVAEKLFMNLKEIDFLGVEFVEENGVFIILEASSTPTLPENFSLNTELNTYIQRIKLEQKKTFTIKNRIRRLMKYIYVSYAEKKGWMGFMLKNWRRDTIYDLLFYRDESINKKIWAHRRGFLSWRIKQYDINKNNLSDFLSDREYRKLRPINNDCLKWLYDKVTMRYVLDGKKEYLPEYYFHLIFRNGNQSIVGLQDLPLQYGDNMQSIFDLVREKEVLICKPTEGSHGDGVLRLEYKNNSLYLNRKKHTQDEIKNVLVKLEKDYVITEYVQMHEDLKKFYRDTTYTLRVMVINKNGLNPWIADAYLRIASDKTGVTDNVSSGGICAKVSTVNGEILCPEQIINHKIEPMKIHPDTKEEICGFVPNWDIVTKGIISISRYIPQLEYLGFDIVITDKGFKVLEINTHQDLHRYPHYNKRIHTYFEDKKIKCN